MPTNCPYADDSFTERNANGLCVCSTFTARYGTQFERAVRSQYGNGSLPQMSYSLKQSVVLCPGMFDLR